MVEQLRSELEKQEVTLVAVSKTRSNDQIMELYNGGQRIFGENRVQELVRKYNELPKDITWHLIGHLQSNKVKQIAPFIDLIHSVDSLKLLKEINKQAKVHQRKIKVLLQMHIAEEESKYGLLAEELKEIWKALSNGELDNILICGLMGMATFTSDQDKLKLEFTNLKNLFDSLIDNPVLTNDFKIRSMGMSGDYKLAIAHGSNMVRIGSLLFR